MTAQARRAEAYTSGQLKTRVFISYPSHCMYLNSIMLNEII